MTLTTTDPVASPQPAAAATGGLPSLETARPTPPARSSAKFWLAFADGCVLGLAMLAAYVTRLLLGDQNIDTSRTAHIVAGAASLVVWLGMFSRQRLYNVRFLGRRLDEVRRIVNASALAVMAMAVAAYSFQLPISRAWLALTYVFAVALMGCEREIVRRIFGALRRSGRLLRGVVIVGCNEEARDIAELLAEDPELGYQVVGFVDDGEHDGSGPVLGTVAQTLAIVRKTGANSVIVAASATDLDTSNRLVRELLREGVRVELSSTLRDIASQRLTVRTLGRFPVVFVEPCESTGWRAVAKRAFDIVVAAVVLVVTAPVALVVSIAIKLESPGPVMFRQMRVGRDGKVFELQKFRSMRVGAHDLWFDLRAQSDVDCAIFKMKDDPRITPIGRFLRKTSIDELPQMWNVLRGEMSLVGPRPALFEETSMWDGPLYDRLRVRPGVTGMWQVSERGVVDMAAYTRLDLYYVDNWSLLTDLIIILKTIPVVISGRGAY